MIQPVLAAYASLWEEWPYFVYIGIVAAVCICLLLYVVISYINTRSATNDTHRHSYRIGQHECLKLPAAANVTFKAVAQDGIELRFKLQADFIFIGRPEGHEPAAVTIMVQLMAAVINHIGQMDPHQTALIYPDKLTDFVKMQSHEQNTGWQLTDLQVADLEVGRNIGDILAKAHAAGVDISKSDLDIDQLARDFS